MGVMLLITPGERKAIASKGCSFRLSWVRW